MSAWLNDALRFAIGALAGLAGAGLTLVEHLTLPLYRARHRRLARRLGVRASTALASYGPEVVAAIGQRARELTGAAEYATTSGTSAAPKLLLYTPARVRLVKRVYTEMFCRLFWAQSVRRRSLFVMSALGDDDSLTAKLLRETRGPSYLAALQAPYRVQHLPAVRALHERFGATAVRLWLITLTNPGLLYATNPSTLSTFFETVASSWTASTALVRELQQRPHALPEEVLRLCRRLASRGSAQRLSDIAASPTSLSVAQWAPGLEAYVCWTGGYVQSFLDRLATHLPPARYRRVPMYSMSTEAIETVAHFSGGDEPAFLPTAPATLYELLPEDATDAATNLLPPWEAREGRSYTLVVSDAFGLRRYQTDDLFHCERLVRGLPDLRFVRRRGWEYSFTGEKLTAEQLAAVFTALRASATVGAEVTFMTCIPSHPPEEAVPHYRLVLATRSDPQPFDAPGIATTAEALLCASNAEYRAKVASGRLLPLRPVVLSQEELTRMVGGARASTWEAQVKFLPLYRRTWEEMRAAPAPSRG